MRTRRRTHRRKWRAGAGDTSTWRGLGCCGGTCRSGRGGEAGGDGDGPGEGETLRLAEAPPGLGSPFQVTLAREWTCPPGRFAVFVTQTPPRPTPRRTLTPPIFILRRERERMRSGGRARVTSFHKERKPAGTVSREEHLLVLALPPYGWRELAQAGTCRLAGLRPPLGGSGRLSPGPLDNCQSPGSPTTAFSVKNYVWDLRSAGYCMVLRCSFLVQGDCSHRVKFLS